MADDVRTLSEALARDPQSLAFIPLGEALRRQGQLDHALKIVVRGLERHPHLADAHDLLARIHADRGESEQAFDEWDVVRRLAPGHAGAAKGMGFICFGQGRLTEAARYLEEALANAPEDRSIALALEMVRDSASGVGSLESGGDEFGGRRSAVGATTSASVSFSPTADRPTPIDPAPDSRLPTPDLNDPRFLFASTLIEDDQTALLLDRDGFVLAGAYFTADGDDLAQEIGAELNGVSDEATRATRHLGIGAWRSIIFEAEAATVAMAPTEHDGLVVLATGGSAPLGLTRRLLERCAAVARRWLGEAP